jgi:hypothetical protein
MYLLVVEDEPRMAQILQAALEVADFTVDVVGTGGDAREALSMLPYDAAVLDLGCRIAMGCSCFAASAATATDAPCLKPHRCFAERAPARSGSLEKSSAYLLNFAGHLCSSRFSRAACPIPALGFGRQFAFRHRCRARRF